MLTRKCRSFYINFLMINFDLFVSTTLSIGNPLEVFCKKSDLINFINFTGKHLQWICIFQKKSRKRTSLQELTFYEIFLSIYFMEYLQTVASVFIITVFNLINIRLLFSVYAEVFGIPRGEKGSKTRKLGAS